MTTEAFYIVLLSALIAETNGESLTAQSVTPSATENIHNSIRSLYVEPPLIFSEVLAEKSKTCVSKMAQGHLGISDHPCEENGESIYLTKQSIQSGPLSPDKLMSLAADAWHDEIRFIKQTEFRKFDENWLKYPSREDVINTGHLMQMLWASTKFVGCASDFYVEGSDRVYYLLCRYSTPADLWNLIERLNNLPVAKPGTECVDDVGCDKIASQVNCLKYLKTRQRCKKSCDLYLNEKQC